MSQSPCGGCPPHCGKCVFSPHAAETPTKATEVVSKKDYGCILPNGGAIVLVDGTLGMMRGINFHPVTTDGADFLHANKNPLAAYC